MNDGLFYILSLERGAWGNDAVWWGPDERGYFADLGRAGKYSKEEALKIMTDDDIPISCEIVEANTHTSVYFDRAQRLKQFALKRDPEPSALRTIIADALKPIDL